MGAIFGVDSVGVVVGNSLCLRSLFSRKQGRGLGVRIFGFCAFSATSHFTNHPFLILSPSLCQKTFLNMGKEYVEEAELVEGRRGAALLCAHVFMYCAHTCTCVNVCLCMHICVCLTLLSMCAYMCMFFSV